MAMTQKRLYYRYPKTKNTLAQRNRNQKLRSTLIGSIRFFCAMLRSQAAGAAVALGLKEEDSGAETARTFFVRRKPYTAKWLTRKLHFSKKSQEEDSTVLLLFLFCFFSLVESFRMSPLLPLEFRYFRLVLKYKFLLNRLLEP